MKIMLKLLLQRCCRFPSQLLILSLVLLFALLLCADAVEQERTRPPRVFRNGTITGLPPVRRRATRRPLGLLTTATMQMSRQSQPPAAIRVDDDRPRNENYQVPVDDQQEKQRRRSDGFELQAINNVGPAAGDAVMAADTATRQLPLVADTPTTEQTKSASSSSWQPVVLNTMQPANQNPMGGANSNQFQNSPAMMNTPAPANVPAPAPVAFNPPPPGFNPPPPGGAFNPPPQNGFNQQFNQGPGMPFNPQPQGGPGFNGFQQPQPQAATTRRKAKPSTVVFGPSTPVGGLANVWNGGPPLTPKKPAVLLGPNTTIDVTTKKAENREVAVKKLINLGQIILVEQENSDFLARYGLAQDYKLRYSPPPLSDPWPLPQVFEESGRLYTINPNDLEWNLMGKGSACPTLTQIIDRYKSETLFISAGTLAADDGVLDPGFLYMPTDSPTTDGGSTTTESTQDDRRGTNRDKGKTSQHPQEFRVFDEELRAKTRFWVQDDRPIDTITVNLVSNCSDWPSRESDETYSLSINGNGITITANEVWGVLYALETLSQLITYNGITFLVRGASILDWPRFRHRGLMLDSSRHFLPKALIKHNIDAMVQNKLNVFHWHLSDDHSFPLHLNSFPNFARQAAYSPEQVYSHQDVREIIEYGRVRGIRVMPEIDSPSHVFSWRHLPTDILTRCHGSDGVPTGDVGPLDPTNNHTYEVLTQVLNEIAQLFPDRAFHAGGDEVPLTCWATNPDITDFRTKFKQLSPVPNQPVLRLEDLVTLYNQKLLSIIRDTRPSDEVPPQVVMWEEAYKNDWNLSKNVTLHVWISDQNLVKFLSDRGYQVLYSQCWYLNYINYGVDWIKFYRCDPSKIGQFVLIPKDTNVAGGEVCLWGEYIDETNLMSTLWPRASAVAERLWSNMTVTDITYAGRRLEEHRCRMLRRGFAAAPVSGPGTCGDSAFRPSHRLRDYKLYEDNHKVKISSNGGFVLSSLGLPPNPVSANGSNGYNGSFGRFYAGHARGNSFDNGVIGDDTIAMCQRLLMSNQAQPNYNDGLFRTGIQYTVQGNFHFSVESVLQLCLITIVIIGCLLMCRGRRMGHGLKFFRPVVEKIYVLCPNRGGSSSSASPSPSPNSRTAAIGISVPTDKLKP